MELSLFYLADEMILESGFGGGHFGVHVVVTFHVQAVHDVFPSLSTQEA
jgi:hypothetical protein